MYEMPESQPRSGARIKPTAQAVGCKTKNVEPRRGERTERNRRMPKAKCWMLNAECWTLIANCQPLPYLLTRPIKYITTDNTTLTNIDVANGK